MSVDPAVVDIHTHLFNARYLPLENIFLSHLGQPSWFKRRLAFLVARLLEHATGSSEPEATARRALTTPDLALESIWACIEGELEARARGMLVAAGGTRSAREYAADRLEEDPLLAVLLEGDALLDALVKAELDDPDDPREDDPSAFFASGRFEVQEPASRRAAIIELVAPLDGPSPSVRGLFAGLGRVAKWLLKKLWKLFDKLATWWEDATGFLTFMRRLLMSEREVFKALAETYQQEEGLLLVHHMMDMEYAYDQQPRYPFLEQQQRMLRLAAGAGGVLRGFTAFDPRRSPPATLGDGFAGFKFYPAMGYRPWDNDVETQEKIEAFYYRCSVEGDYPVFAHCTPIGFEAHPGYGKNAHPKYWKSALKEFPNLRLCLGHAGGGDMTNTTNGDLRSPGWYAKSDREWSDDDNFAKIVVALCTTYDHVYCEVGHLHEVLVEDSDERKAFEQNFVREWTSTTSNTDKNHFSKKCMFGSDHHMPMMINRAADLLKYFRNLFARKGLTGLTDFCSGNAIRYLNDRRTGLD